MENKVNLDLSTDTFPRKTLNGSSFEQLLKDVNAIVVNFQKLEHTLLRAYPHPRDYRSDDDYQKANAQHEQHLKVIQELQELYVKKWIHINDECERKTR
jgi:adenylate kinase family enzyme